MWKVFSNFSLGVFHSRFSMQIGNLHLVKKMHFLLFVTPFVPFVAAVLFKELILHLPSTTCSSLLCGWDVHGPCSCSASGEEPPLSATATTGGGLLGTLCCCGVTQHCGQRGSRDQGSLDPFCGLAATCMLLWEFPISLKHRRVVKTFWPFYVLFFPLPFLWAGT